MKRSTDRSSRMPTRACRLGLFALLAALAGCGTVQERPDAPSGPDIEAPAPVDKGDPRARFNAAMDLWRQNQIAETEAAFVELAQDFPDHAGPWTNLGILFAKSNRRDQAIGALGKAATLNPQNKVAFNWLGILYREAGNHDRARLSYERALAIDPNYALAHYNLGVLLDAHLKRPADALPHYRDYLRLAGTEDLRVMAWIAEIEAASPPPAATPAAAPVEPAQ